MRPTKASGTLLLASTTTTQDSGLLDVLIPEFENETGYTVKLVAGDAAKVTKALAAKRLYVSELRPEEVSLEDVFLELTGGALGDGGA